MASTGQTHEVILRRCKGGGHYASKCPSPRMMIVTRDGGYESASVYDEETLALIASEEKMILNMRCNTWLLKMLTGMRV